MKEDLSRRNMLKSTAAGAVGAATLANTATAEQYSPTRKSASEEPLLWATETEFGITSSSPTVIDGTAYVGGRDGRVYAFDIMDGSIEWTFQAEGLILPSPTVVEDVIYIASNDNHVYALPADPDWEEGSAVDGDYLWRFETDDDVAEFNHIWGSPTVYNGSVYVGNKDGYVYAIDASTGEQEWRFDEPDDWVTSAPTVANDVVYIGSDDGFLYALDAEDGTEKWRFQGTFENRPEENMFGSSPTVHDGTVYIGVYGWYEAGSTTDTRSSILSPEDGIRQQNAAAADEPETIYFGGVYAVDAEEGTEKWAVDTDGWIRSSPTVADDTVYVGAEFDDANSIYALDSADGSELWTANTDAGVESSPTVADEIVYFGDYNGSTYALDTATGDINWTFEGGDGNFRSSPTVRDGVVYIGIDAGHGGEDTRMFALDAKHNASSRGSRVSLGTLGHHHKWAERAAEDDVPADEDELWSFETEFGVMKSGPTIIDETVYVGTREGILYAVDTVTGEKEWEFLAEGIINPSPTVIDNTVYIASNDNSVYALDANPDWEAGSAEAGDYLWRFETDEQDIHYEDLHHIWGSPTVLDGTVYVGNNSGYAYAIDAETGEQEWRFDEPEDWITTAPTVVDETVYIGAGWGGIDKHLYAINAETGEEEWRFQAEGDIASSATVADGTVYVGSHLTEEANGGSAAMSAHPNIDPETGKIADSVTTQQEWEFSGWMHAVDAEDGTEMWSMEADHWIRGSPTASDGSVYIGSNDGLLHALEADTGQKEWTFAAVGGIDESSPTVVDNTVFVADDPAESGGSVYGIDTMTGEKEWKFETEAAGFRSSPTVVDGVLYIGSDAGHGGEDSNLYAVNTGLEGSSNGSRVELGTHGHHHEWGAVGVREIVDYYTDTDGEVNIFEAAADWRADEGAFAPQADVEGSIFDVAAAWR